MLEVEAITSIADYFIICSAPNDRLVHAIADHIQRETRSHGSKPLSIEGERQGEWILLDYGSVVVHVFLEESRQFYRIERLFSDAPEIEWNKAAEAVS